MITGTPDWAAAPANGCRRGAQFGAVRAGALPAYRRLIADVLDRGRAEGADVRFFSPWNEPNHPYFLSPAARAAATPRAPVARGRALCRAGARDARRARAAAGGDQRLVLGETAGLLEPSARATSVREMIRGLPRELVCSAPVWSQHAYIGGTDPVADRHGRARDAPLPAPARDLDHRDRRRTRAAGLLARRGITASAQGCGLLHRRLLELVPGPARHARRPVHVPRGRPVPDRPRHHRPQARPRGARRVAGLGRARRADRAAAAARPAASARPGRAARARAS